MKVLEKDVRTGLVDMTPEDPLQWKIVDDLSRLSLPANRQARVLLFVHGTFSSTVGSYGALARTDAGRAALAASRRKYDVVLGFDHRTLSDDPMGNAADLLAILERLFKDRPPTVDVIGYSRGGLVFRAFAEELLPKSTWQPTIGRAVFIAVPNAGTSLSGSEHWPLLIDFYTNLAVAASRALALIPAVGAVEPILAESLKGLGALVKYVVTGVAEEDGGVPGLAAMNPRGSFITTLNQTQSDQPTVANTWYAAITSEFEPSQDPNLWPAELPQRLFQRILDANVDFIFGGSNDLVVDTASMTAIDVPVNAFVKARFEFGKGTKVYHLCYFIQQEVATALTNWLELAP
jgi:pimeloyl-ACP methyl ester carboxylesterase